MRSWENGEQLSFIVSVRLRTVKIMRRFREIPGNGDIVVGGPEKREPGQKWHSVRACIVISVPGPLSGPERNVVRRCSHVPRDSATALLFGAASAALGRGLRSVTFGAASAALCRSLLGVAFLAASACRGAAASHHAGARKKSGDADPCQELLEFLCVHGTPPFVIKYLSYMNTIGTVDETTVLR